MSSKWPQGSGFWKQGEKEQNCNNQHFLLFPQCCLHTERQVLWFEKTFSMSSSNAFNLDQEKRLSCGKEILDILTEKTANIRKHLYKDLYPYTLDIHLTLSQMTNFWLFQTEKSLQTIISSLMKMVELFSKQVENTVGRGWIARYEQFIFFLQCFQKTCTADT